jgi:hypothetical protein
MKLNLFSFLIFGILILSIFQFVDTKNSGNEHSASSDISDSKENKLNLSRKKRENDLNKRKKRRLD